LFITMILLATDTSKLYLKCIPLSCYNSCNGTASSQCNLGSTRTPPY